MTRKYLTQGSSRNVFALDENPEVVLKSPIPERIQAGTIQNRTEVENFNLSKELGLECFASVLEWKDDFSQITVEKCSPVSLRFIEDNFREKFGRCGVGDVDILKFFAWNAVTAFNKIVQAAERRGFARTAKDFRDFIERHIDILAISNNPSVNLVVEIFANKDDFKPFGDILEFSLYHPRNLLVDDLWHVGQYGIDNKGRLVVLDYGYSVDLSNTPLYSARKRKINAMPPDFNAKISFNVGTLRFLMNDLHQTLMISGPERWTVSQKTVFMKPDTIRKSINAVRKEIDGLRIFRVETDWETRMVFEKLENETRTPLTENIEFCVEPQEGLVPLELFIQEDNCVRTFYSPCLESNHQDDTIGEICEL